MDMVDGIVSEIKRNPYTSIAALACFVGMPFMYTMKADAGDVRALTEQIGEVRTTMQREFTVGELNNVRRELFDINLRISTLEREDTPIDTLLYRRRDDLLSQQRRLEARLQSIDSNETRRR